MGAKETLIVIAIILLSPLILYLRDQTYRNLYGNATIREDIESLFSSFKEWRYRRELKKKYKCLNKKPDGKSRTKENHR